MNQLIRLVYASRSTFSPGEAHQGLDPSVARILAKSRKNNAERGIVGGLFFGDGCFLQCLEGPDEAVDRLYERIRADSRHRDVTVLSRNVIARISFGAWSMKYAPGEAPLRRLMQTLGVNRFDPYAMSPQDIEAAVAYIEREVELVTPPQGKLGDRSDAPIPKAPVSFIDTFKARPTVSKADSAAAAGSSVGNLLKVVVGVASIAVMLAWGYLSRKS